MHMVGCNYVKEVGRPGSHVDMHTCTDACMSVQGVGAHERRLRHAHGAT